MDKMISFEYYQSSKGEADFISFLESLPTKDQVKLLAVIEKTEKYGIAVAIQNQWVKKLDHHLFELRSKVGSNIQRVIYFHVVENRYVITHGFTKKTNKTPELEKKRAHKIRERFMEEENNGNYKS